jgi:branched-chain amino acid transport system permease protein
VGAYAAAFAAKGLGAGMAVGLLLAPFAAGALALAVGAFVVRMSGVYLAMLTLAFAQIAWAVAFQWVEVTGGDNGVLGVWPDPWAADKRAEAVGLDAYRLRWVAFGLAGAGAGLSGAVFAYAKGSVFPTYMAIPHSVDALVMVLLGGVQTMAGPIVGAVSFTVLHSWLLMGEFWRIKLGLLIMALVLAFPAGIAGAASAAWERWRGRAS